MAGRWQVGGVSALRAFCLDGWMGWDERLSMGCHSVWGEVLGRLDWEGGGGGDGGG